MITQRTVAEKIGSYLRHQIPLAQLVDWAETAVMDADFESTIARDAAAYLGLADVRAFGLTWEDCERLLRELGFAARVEIASAP